MLISTIVKLKFVIDIKLVRVVLDLLWASMSVPVWRRFLADSQSCNINVETRIDVNESGIDIVFSIAFFP